MNIKSNKNYVDNRGKISMVLESCKVGSISRIECEPGSIRARHWHKNDGHWIIVNEGQVLLYEQVIGSEEVKKFNLQKGDIQYTGPNVLHEMVFNVYTVFDCYSDLQRDSEHYENDTVRFDYSLEEKYIKYTMFKMGFTNEQFPEHK